jgi:virginiamycin B lyase
MFRLPSLWRRGGRRTTPRSRSAAVPARPTLEGLEDRCLLSTVTEVAVPNYQSPMQITNGPDGAFWYTAVGNDPNRPNVDFVGRLSLSGTPQEFPIPTPRAQPLGIVTGSDNNLWFAETNVAKIGKLTPTGILEYPIPSGADPGMITAGPDGALWFTEPDVNRIGRITTSGVITEYPIPTADSQPSDIIAGSNLDLWFTEQNGNRIGRISEDGNTITEVRLPTGNSQPTSLTLASDGSVWFTESNANKYGRITTNSTVTEFTLPITNSQPTAITSTADGNLAMVLHNANQIARITVDGGLIDLTPVPTADPDVQGIAAGPSSIVFAEAGPAKIGVIGAATIDPNKAFVQSLYVNILGRQGGDDELNIWITNALPFGNAAVVNGIEQSPEARKHLVETWYGTYLGRPPAPGEVQPWVNLLLQGNTEESVLSGILGSPEFAKRAAQMFPTAATPSEQIVRAYYSLLLHRTAGPQEVNFWVGQLGASNAQKVASQILASVEYRTDTVIDYYRRLLKRPIDPAAFEVNPWVNSSLDLGTIRAAIEASPEYYLKA